MFYRFRFNMAFTMAINLSLSQWSLDSPLFGKRRHVLLAAGGTRPPENMRHCDAARQVGVPFLWQSADSDARGGWNSSSLLRLSASVARHYAPPIGERAAMRGRNRGNAHAACALGAFHRDWFGSHHIVRLRARRPGGTAGRTSQAVGAIARMGGMARFRRPKT
jgi:hypothetical protein